MLTVTAQTEEQEVLQVVDRFFVALEDQDTALFKGLFLQDAFNYFIQDQVHSIRIGGRSPQEVKFNTERIIKEKLRKQGVEVKIHKRIAVVWAPYNLWVNDDFSHCGVDVFTLMKTRDGWKIASLSYSIEPEGYE